ncbi:ATP-binding protein [Collimonas pratensis]|uniref:histidine kinase n=1 Tax=Collimonas pratensis TaxID=279113 RepID=A0ABM5Z887_9BURK|nr:ATP-binding protein [Collimonas pratensis]AMP15334.1 his Kinase A domain protein [Collimonas pratensis]NKI69733.1 sensor histidine kinase [Collimonas pratensis]
MDGIQRRLKDSIQFRLSLWLSLAILAVALLAGVFAFISGFDEAHEFQDDMLRQVAAMFDQQQLPLPPQGDGPKVAIGDEESRVIVQYLGVQHLGAQYLDDQNGGANIPGTKRLKLPATLPDGMQTIHSGHHRYRVLVKTLASQQRIAVAQETAVRDEIARDSGLRTLMPFLILIPLLLLLVAHLVRKMFRPIARLSAEIDGRNEQELHALAPEPLPVEVRPFVIAINRLLERVAQAMETQRRFVADAAHELRSPLTALSLQAERLAEADMPDTARQRLATLRQGIERGRRLLDQLLALARAQSAPLATNDTVAVMQVYRRVLEDLMPLAEARQIDIGVEGEAGLRVPVTEVDLITIVRNLVDNAIRYTPPGGRISLSMHNDCGGVSLQVEDSGPGIAPEEQARVFDPFYRVLGNEATGSGLGLSIVQTIASRIGARVTLAHADREAQSGLCVTVFFPAPAVKIAV